MIASATPSYLYPPRYPLVPVVREQVVIGWVPFPPELIRAGGVFTAPLLCHLPCPWDAPEPSKDFPISVQQYIGEYRTQAGERTLAVDGDRIEAGLFERIHGFRPEHR